MIRSLLLLVVLLLLSITNIKSEVSNNNIDKSYDTNTEDEDVHDDSLPARLDEWTVDDACKWVCSVIPTEQCDSAFDLFHLHFIDGVVLSSLYIASEDQAVKDLKMYIRIPAFGTRTRIVQALSTLKPYLTASQRATLTKLRKVNASLNSRIARVSTADELLLVFCRLCLTRILVGDHNGFVSCPTHKPHTHAQRLFGCKRISFGALSIPPCPR